jgi:hypothetical protein
MNDKDLTDWVIRRIGKKFQYSFSNSPGERNSEMLGSLVVRIKKIC